MRRLFRAFGILLLLASHSAVAVGFQWETAPDADNTPLRVAIWYPSDNPTAETRIGPFDMEVAMNGAASAGLHPLIVMSHGTGGMALDSYDTAMALAEAGFVVAAVTHTGDNYQDRSTSFTRRDFVDRTRHISRVIDFMLGAWPSHLSIDPARIGIFGHSAGGATALITVGGVADMSKSVTFCREKPDDWGCQQARQRGPAPAEPRAIPVAGTDTRIKAAVVAAPAIGFAFSPNGLAAVKVPVQLWVGAEDDIVTDGTSFQVLLPVPPDYHLVPHAGHFAYLAPCNAILEAAAPVICGDPPGFDRPAFLREIHTSVIALYRDHLN